jgi:hypothetical protein
VGNTVGVLLSLGICYFVICLLLFHWVFFFYTVLILGGRRRGIRSVGCLPTYCMSSLGIILLLGVKCIFESSSLLLLPSTTSMRSWLPR